MRRPAARGFTLLETILAAVLGLMIVGVVGSMFAAIDRADRLFARQAEATHEVAVTQQVMRRAFGAIVLLPLEDAPEPEAEEQPEEEDEEEDEGVDEEGGDQDQDQDQEQDQEQDQDEGADDEAADEEDADREQEQEAEENEPPPYPRVILEFDTAPSLFDMFDYAGAIGAKLVSPYDGDLSPPQRLELVLSDHPAAGAIMGAERWARRSSAARDALYEVTAPPRAADEGGRRGVFELRPDGMRERLLYDAGVASRAIALADRARPPPVADEEPPDGWTLWWRPVYDAEIEARREGRAFDIGARPELLAEAVPLMSGLERARWRFTATDEEDPTIADRYTRFRAITYQDMPAYVEFEFTTTTGDYGNWMFEVIYSVAEEEQRQESADGEEQGDEGEDGASDDGEGGSEAGADGALLPSLGELESR